MECNYTIEVYRGLGLVLGLSVCKPCHNNGSLKCWHDAESPKHRVEAPPIVVKPRRLNKNKP